LVATIDGDNTHFKNRYVLGGNVCAFDGMRVAKMSSGNEIHPSLKRKDYNTYARVALGTKLHGVDVDMPGHYDYRSVKSGSRQGIESKCNNLLYLN
jgi:hypothetical protein